MIIIQIALGTVLGLVLFCVVFVGLVMIEAVWLAREPKPTTWSDRLDFAIPAIFFGLAAYCAVVVAVAIANRPEAKPPMEVGETRDLGNDTKITRIK